MILEAEAAMARALARVAWGRMTSDGDEICLRYYPGGVEDYVQTEWMKYREDAMAALAALEKIGFTLLVRKS